PGTPTGRAAPGQCLRRCRAPPRPSDSARKSPSPRAGAGSLPLGSARSCLRSILADLVELRLQRHAVELVDRKIQQEVDARGELREGLEEGLALLVVRSLHGGGILD